MQPAHRIPYEQTFDALYGLELLGHGDDEATARVAVRDAVKQPMGVVHGGLYASIAESLASLATAAVVVPEGSTAMGLSNATSFLRPITEGTVHAHARRVHRGRTTWIWDVEIRDDAGRLCAMTRMTIAVRPAPAP
ncbi:MAG: PaaI family thioesterase [Actinomycetota bacterium]|nr:PaaI family thioesterase [Actinomycetota bacterium]